MAGVETTPLRNREGYLDPTNRTWKPRPYENAHGGRGNHAPTEP